MSDAGRALVTGGGKGIGRAVALRLAAGGLDVVVTGRDTAALHAVAAEARELGSTITPEPCDVTEERDVVGVVERHGPVRVLVNNAGIAASAPLERTTLEAWRRLLDVNATGAFLCTRAVLPGMRAAGTGRIVTVASVAGLTGARYIAAYSASKHAAIGLMRSVAVEVAGSGITANAVCPGYVRTDMTERAIATIMETTGRTREAAVEALLGRSRLGRLIEPDEVAAAVEFLCGEDAAAINGQTIVIDGGELQQ